MEACSIDYSNLFSDLYSQTSFEDTFRTIILVYAVYILQTIQIILLTKDGFLQFLIDFGNLAAFLEAKTIWLSLFIIQSLGVCDMLRICTNI